MVTRVEWKEPGTANKEPTLFIAETTGNCWQFFARSSFEVRWHQEEATPELIRLANEKSRGYHCQHR